MAVWYEHLSPSGLAMWAREDGRYRLVWASTTKRWVAVRVFTQSGQSKFPFSDKDKVAVAQAVDLHDPVQE